MEAKNSKTIVDNMYLTSVYKIHQNGKNVVGHQNGPKIQKYSKNQKSKLILTWFPVGQKGEIQKKSISICNMSYQI